MILAGATGCGGSKDPRFQKWGGMSEEEWLAQYKKRREEELEREKQEQVALQKESASQRAGRAPRESTPPSAPPTTTSAAEGVQEVDYSDEAATAAPQKPPEITLPESFHDWQIDHYREAWKTDSPRLEDAILFLGQLYVGDPGAAEKLSELLELYFQQYQSATPAGTPDDEFVPVRSDRSGRNARDLVRCLAVLDALRTNQTNNAERALRNAWREAARRHDQALIREWLPRLVQAEDEFSKKVRSQLWLDLAHLYSWASSEQEVIWLKQPLEELLRQTTVPEVRKELFVVFAQVPGGPLRQTVFNLLSTSDPANAPVILAVLDCSARERHPNIWRAALDLSQTAWEAALVESSMRPLVDTPTDWVWKPAGDGSLATKRIALRIWDSKNAQTVVNHLNQVIFLQDSPGLLAFSMSVPQPIVRQTLFQVFLRRWLEGPESARIGLSSFSESSEAPSQASRYFASDPGGLVVLKKLLRLHYQSSYGFLVPEEPVPRSVSYSAGAVRQPREFGVPQLVSGGPSEARDRNLYQRWFNFTYAMLRHLTEVCSQVSSTAPDADNSLEKRLRFRLHRADLPSFRLHVSIDSDTLGLIEPTQAAKSTHFLELEYCRFVDRAKATTLTNYYKRALPGAIERPIRYGIWLDHWAEDKEGRCASTDVRLTAARPEDFVGPQQENDIQIEILRIEIPSLEVPRVSAEKSE